MTGSDLGVVHVALPCTTCERTSTGQTGTTCIAYQYSLAVLRRHIKTTLAFRFASWMDRATYASAFGTEEKAQLTSMSCASSPL